MRCKIKLFIGLICCLLIGGCATAPAPAPNSTEFDCLALLQQTDRVLKKAGVMPSSSAPIAGFPHYRINRFLAEFRHHDLSQTQMPVWLQHLSQQAQQSRNIALQALPAQQRARLPKNQQTECTERLREFDLAHPERLQTLRRKAVVADDYVTAARIIGLYPLFSIPVRAGIKNLHAEFRHTFAKALSDLAQQGRLLRYVPAQPRPQLSTVISRDALAIPQATEQQLHALFLRHAPIWDIDVAADYDRPGRPVWRSPGNPGVDNREALTFHYASYTWWQGQPLLQLNYLIWFDQRPLQSTFDILGGALDGVLWRVTLGPDQQPLLYDSIHACGCYHLFFPSTALRLRAEAEQLPEPPFVAQPAPKLNTDERIAIRLASVTHYIERIYPASTHTVDPVQSYALINYDELYRTPVSNDGQRSLFEPTGLVLGTERAERALLWPLGVAEPGAMRERGRHPVAFVGRRHFDDADLLSSLFELTR